jgi:hypothetical protein
MRYAVGVLLLGLILGGCGDDVAAIAIHVHLHGYDVPGEVDNVHFRLNDGSDVFWERTYDLPANETDPVLPIERGPRTPDPLTLMVSAAHGSVLVDQSDTVEIRFRGGEVRDVHVSIPAE